MRILVIGANGQIGRIVVDKLKDSEHKPVAMVRKEDQAAAFKEEGVETVFGDLEQDISRVFDNIDTVVFTAGSGPHTGADKTILIDQEGAMESIDLARENGVKHYVMVSGLGVENPRQAGDKMRPYMHAKYRADEHLKQSGLSYTILRPGLLTNDPATDKVALFDNQPEPGEVTRADVASVLAEIINQKPADRVYYLLGGQTPVAELF